MLQVVTHAFFEQGDFADKELLELTYKNLNKELSEEKWLRNLPTVHLSLGVDASFLFREFGKHALTLYKLLFLEKRVVVYSSPVGKSCNTFLSLLSLFPGLLSSISAYTRPSTEDLQKHNFKGYGHPLTLLKNQEVLLEPYLSLHHLDDVKKKKGFLFGCSNLLFTSLPSRDVDVVVDLNKKSIQVHPKDLDSALKLTSADERFLSHLLFHINNNCNGEWKGSDSWVRAEMRAYLETFYACLANVPHIFDKRNRTVDVSDLYDYNITWVRMWMKTQNFKKWFKSVDPKVISRPGAR